MGWWPFTRRSRHTGAVTRTLVVRAKFDSAQTTADNRRHWANADGLSADAAANAEVRRILRNRARYEVANNSYGRGIVLTLANDVIGTGPRLQMLTDSAEVNQTVEREPAEQMGLLQIIENISHRTHRGRSLRPVPPPKHPVT